MAQVSDSLLRVLVSIQKGSFWKLLLWMTGLEYLLVSPIGTILAMALLVYWLVSKRK